MNVVLQIPAGGTALDADLMIPEAARGVVLLAHGSGSSRHSPRNRYVARGRGDSLTTGRLVGRGSIVKAG